MRRGSRPCGRAGCGTLLIQGPPCGYDRAAAIVAVSAGMDSDFRGARAAVALNSFQGA
jgi:hypothetical protein